MNIRSTLITVGNRFPSSLASRMKSRSWATRPARALANRLLPERSTLVTVRSGRVKGLHLEIFPRSEKFLWTGTHEPEVQEALSNLLAPGMTFWDIGAHVGYFTLLASRLVGPSGRVHAFEPMPQTFDRLLRSIDAEGATNVVPHSIAIAPQAGTTLLHGGEVSVVWSLLPNEGTNTVRVQSQTLADSFAAYGPPNLIKVDAEGAEVEILASGSNELASFRVPVLLEASSQADLTAARDRLPFYHIQRIDVNHWLLTV